VRNRFGQDDTTGVDRDAARFQPALPNEERCEVEDGLIGSSSDAGADRLASSGKSLRKQQQQKEAAEAAEAAKGES
jgi:hypothetical protein